ncbi:MAG: hypothetical protein A2289_25900 [Deltaproteobacteria bacterium RIFOXYA12_FULL_58_15]|nr:MAG: hypothetical protein A2289_25900 [Deltaproteobacteria bacterium RIFOXYA12_FULL_58_15]OGR10551.1 MAG: hypothetical protein A2341_09695 [Deltaproteobacteria bacterium RIFOXYB12_FULL_58_9]
MTDKRNPDPVSSGQNSEMGGGPIGQMTRYAMTVAGLDARNTKNRIGLIVGALLVVSLVGIVTIDLTGIMTIPGMGMVYDVTGLEDPNLGRTIERVEAKLTQSDLSDKERKALQDKLMGAQNRAQATGLQIAPNTKGRRKAGPGEAADNVATTGVEDTQDLADKERAQLLDIFNDNSKKEAKVSLVEPDQIQTPNLPSGLTREAIYKVITDGSGAMSLCIAEAARKGEMLQGRMEVSMTIAADGTVKEAAINTPKFSGSVVGKCTSRRIRNWKFPRFNGEAITVVYPYVLGGGF